jgi:MoxR-like ATPase
LLGGGHLLVQDLPGTGKTLLAKSLAAAIGGHFGRVQCTPDLLPADLTGTSVYSPATGAWEFRPGPVFANVVLVDELNRASPRTQAALLEPMEERQVTVDGERHPLPEPFFCIATENPFGSSGTFSLPESQLDRFGIVLELGMPARDAEREILVGTGGTPRLPEIEPVTTPEGIRAAIVAASHTHVASAIVEYVLDLAEATRTHPAIVQGASPRATLGMLAAARAHALLAARNYVSPSDVQAVAVGALAHRITLREGVDLADARVVLQEILERVPAPRP